MEWRIRPPADGEVKVNPIQGQFFTTEGLKEKASALVRETVQNSMDAKTDDITPGEEKEYPVEIRFFFSGGGEAAALPPEKHKKYFNGLMPHILAEKNGLIRSDIPDFDEPMPFIAIEDFNTTGLTGDPERNTDPEEGTNRKHSFYWFWRNVGRSDKGEYERGKWGLGKTVFSYSSRISTFFGITMREEDDEKLLMGQCIFRIHCLEDGTEFTPYGYFGKYKINESPEPPSYFALPLNWDEIPDNVEEDFRLKRENHMGFSVIIPFPREELTLMEVARAASLEYFYPIIAGDLRIILEDGWGNEIKFTRTRIERELNKLNFENEERKKINLLKTINFTRWALNVPEEDYIKLKVPNPDLVPRWKKELLLNEGLEGLLENVQERFESGDRIAFRVPVKVHEEGRSQETGWLSVFIEKDNELSKSEGYFIREDLTISEVPNKVTKNDVRFIVRVENPPLIKMLGDAENPAHTQWQKKSENFRDKYIHGPKCLDFIIYSPQGLMEFLIKPPEGIDVDILRDIFSIEGEDEITGTIEVPPEQPEGETTPPPFPEIRGVSKFSIIKISGGVKIYQNPNSETPEYASVKLGYAVFRGNPIKKYNPLDFNISESPITVDSEGIEVIACDENELEFKIKKDNYWIKITGFDTQRDLRVVPEERDA